MAQPRPYAEYRDTPLWHALANALTELVATREITVATVPDYVIGHFCQQLVARKLVVPAGLVDAP